MRQTLEQKRANFALKKINLQPTNEEYGQYIKKLPAMIINNGLGQAMAFLLAKVKDKDKNNSPSWILYSDLQEWIDTDSLINFLMENDRSKYIHAQEEILKLLSWMSKFADAYIQKKTGEKHG